jgi:glycosyltransferase involved in cell wall biosynthesis
MSCARPVVVTKEGGPSEAVQNNGLPAGLLVPFGSETELAEALITILQDEQLAKRMGANGSKRISLDFTWERVVERIDSVYQEMLDGSSP